MADHDEAGVNYEVGGDNNWRGTLAGARDRLREQKGRNRNIEYTAYHLEHEGRDRRFRDDVVSRGDIDMDNVNAMVDVRNHIDGLRDRGAHRI